MDKSFDREEIKQTHFVRSNVIAKCSLVRVFLKAVPGSVQHNTAVDSVTKVPIISDKELKSMKNDLQFRSRTPFRGLAVKSDRSRDREPSRNISLRKVIQSLKFRKLRSKVKNVLKKSVPASSALHNIACNYKLWKIRHLKSKQVSLEKQFSNKFFQCFQFSPPASTCSLQLPFVLLRLVTNRRVVSRAHTAHGIYRSCHGEKLARIP